jgi:hypothetical protein
MPQASETRNIIKGQIFLFCFVLLSIRFVFELGKKSLPSLSRASRDVTFQLSPSIPM